MAVVTKTGVGPQRLWQLWWAITIKLQPNKSGGPCGGDTNLVVEVVDMIVEGSKNSAEKGRRENTELSGKLQVTLRQSSQIY